MGSLCFLSLGAKERIMKKRIAALIVLSACAGLIFSISVLSVRTVIRNGNINKMLKEIRNGDYDSIQIEKYPPVTGFEIHDIFEQGPLKTAGRPSSKKKIFSLNKGDIVNIKQAIIYYDPGYPLFPLMFLLHMVVTGGFLFIFAELTAPKALPDKYEEYLSGILVISDSRRQIVYSNDPDLKGGLETLMHKIPEVSEEIINDLGKIKEDQKRFYDNVIFNGRNYNIELKYERGFYYIFMKDLTKERFLKNEILKNSILSTMGEFSSMIAHELRNPLGTIKASASTIREYEDLEENLKLLDYIIQETERLSNLVDKMLNFSRDISLNRQRTDIKQMLLNMRDVIENAIGQDNELNFSFKDPVIYADIDEALFKVIVMNICENASKAIALKGKKGIVNISAYRKGGRIIIEISNNGIKISGNIGRIFDPFYTTDTKGFGLGLAISKKIAELHGGRIEARSEEDRTDFKIILEQ